MIYLHKILPLIFSPLMFVIILIIWALIINSRKIVIIGTIILIISSLPIVSKKLVAYLESNYEQINLSDIDTADAIVKDLPDSKVSTKPSLFMLNILSTSIFFMLSV